MHCRFDSSIFILQLTVLMLSAKWPGEKIRYCDVHIQLTRLQNCYRLNPHKIGGGGAEKKNQNGKKTASRQQDAHGPEKDDWLDSGNGEKSRGRRGFGSQLCSY